MLVSGKEKLERMRDGRVVYVPGGAPQCATASSDTLLTFRLR